MPRKNGIQVIEAVRKFISGLQFTYKIQIVEPKFVFLTAHASAAFKTHLKSIKISEMYEKPL